MSFLIGHHRCLRSTFPALQALQLKTDLENRAYRSFPHYTRQGYHTARLPPALRERLTRTWTQKRHQARPEDSDPRYITGPGGADAPPAYMLQLSEHDPDLVRDLEAFVKQELEAWTGMTHLRHTSTYGIREYTDGAVLHTHVDRHETHILSAIVHVGSLGARRPWHLAVQNRHMKQPVEIAFTPEVDVILYESASLAHGRPKPFQGERFANLFLHFAPHDWGETLQRLDI
jgi:hypothetical protein